MIKSGANVMDIERIKELHAQGESVEVISRDLLIDIDVVQTFVDEIEGVETDDEETDDEE